MKKFIHVLLITFLISSNLLSKDLEILSDLAGTGIEIQKHFKVHVNYRGTLEDGTEFDSSFKRNKPFVFQIGLGQVILGWEKGLLGMKVGGKRTLKIPPELAYGSRGSGNLIPPNSTLIFEVEIINAFKPGYSKIISKNLTQKQKDGFILIDIRAKDEIKKTGTIDGSIKITAFDSQGNFNKNFIKLYQNVANKNDHVVFISNYGTISDILANGFVEKLGSINMYSLEGGIQNWVEEGRVLKYIN
mgnify:CR=1 FL=1